jgi:hypothetical protein
MTGRAQRTPGRASDNDRTSPLPAAVVRRRLWRGLRGMAVDIRRPRKTIAEMLAFTDSQLRIVWTAANRLPVEKRGVFLEHVVARLQMYRGFTDTDLDDAVRAALTGLIQSAA